MQQLQGPAVQAQGLHPLRRPAEAGAGQAECRGRGNDADGFQSEPLHQDGADAVAGRVPGREHAHRAAAQPFQGVVQGIERLRPGDALAISRTEQIEVPLSAHRHASQLDHRTRRGRQPVRAVVAHAHHGEPGSHRTTGPGAAAADAMQWNLASGEAPLGARASRPPGPEAREGPSAAGPRMFKRAGRTRSQEAPSTMSNRGFIAPVDRKARSPRRRPWRCRRGVRAG